MNQNDTQKAIASGKTVLGIEFGSTRIKAALIDENHTPLAAMSGKTNTKTAFGHIVLKLFGRVCKKATRN